MSDVVTRTTRPDEAVELSRRRAIATAFSPNIWWLIGLRGILGFGIGGDYPVSATIMSEYAAKRHRGREPDWSSGP
jgi:MFS family permease